MPIYEYVCRACAERFEVLVHAGEKPKCPGCGARKLDKQLSVFAVGASAPAATAAPAPGACGRCGDPRGPGSCGLD